MLPSDQIRKTLLIFNLLAFFTISSCDRDHCPSPHMRYFSNCNDTASCIENVERINIDCFEFNAEGLLIIQNDSIYKSYFQDFGNRLDCDTYEFPQIDFANFTLVCFHTSCAGCDYPSFEYELVRGENGEGINIIVYIWQYGKEYTALFPINHFLLFPKIDTSQDVSLEFKWYDCDCV